MLTAATVSAQSGQGFLTILITGLVVVGLAYLAVMVLFGMDDSDD